MKVKEKLLPEEYAADTYLDRSHMAHFLSKKLLAREPQLMSTPARLWQWVRAGDRTVVMLHGGPLATETILGKSIIALGWSERGKNDPMNEYVGVSIALVRALRMLVPKGKEKRNGKRS